MKRRWPMFAGMLLLAGMAGAGERWYDEKMLERGERVFAEHCASCHGDRAQGKVEDWKKPLPDGSYPAPPLNGTAHAWHHPLPVLLRQIRKGGRPLGGTMPGFEGRLDREDMLAAIAWFQSHWPDRVYAIWERRNRAQARPFD